MKRLILFALISITNLYAESQDLSLFEKRWFVQNGDTLPYRILYPANFDTAKKYPLVFFLHGSGERGSDNEIQLVHGAKFFLADSARLKYPAFIIFPQCAKNKSWSNVQQVIEDSLRGKRTSYFVDGGIPSNPMTLLQQLIFYTIQNYPVEKKQVYVGGLSMGAMGTYELVSREPKLFAAAFAICGRANTAIADRLRYTRWWLFHGMKDDVVLPVYTQQMEVALKKAGANVKATYYPDANHNSWAPAFAEPGLMRWLFAQRRR